MKGKIMQTQMKILVLALLTVLMASTFVTIPTIALTTETTEQQATPPESFTPEELRQMLGMPPNGDNKLDPLYGDTNFLPQSMDLSNFLINYESDYLQTYQPWKSKAAVRCIAVTDDYEFVAVGGGYLYDNEVHIYRWNPEINQYVKVWNSGDEIIKSDVTDVDIADTDHNQFLEIVATSADGHFYVFEQKHIFDPYTNTENMFEHVYTSPYIGSALTVEINDTDKDFQPDIIVGSWDYKIHVYEYTVHSGYPFSPEHWITYEEKWASRNLGTHPTSIVVGDTNYNGLPDIVVGTREGAVYVFENNGTVLDIQGQPFPLCQDNSYHQIYFNNETIWRPIYSMAIGDLDNQKGDEVGIAAYAFNAYVLRYDQTAEEYYIQKLIKGFEKWTLKDDYPADEYIDWGVESQNTYMNLQSVKLGTSVADPVNYTTQWYFKGPYPYNSGASVTDYPCKMNFTTGVYFKPNSTHAAWETFDFGADEEGTGNGNSKADFLISFNMSIFSWIDLDDLIISISPDYEHWLEIPQSSMYNSVFENKRSLNIDVDSVLSANRWTYFRYVNITVKANASQEYWIYGGKLNYVNMPVSTALSVTTGTLSEKVGSEQMQFIFGTVDGRLVAFIYNETSNEFSLSWDSWVDDRYSLGSNIWALQQVHTTGAMPNIIGYTLLDGTYLFRGEMDGDLPVGEDIIDFAYGDIDLDDLQIADLLVTTDKGNIFAFDTSFSYQSAMTVDYLNEINSLPYYDGLNLTVAIADIDQDYYGPEIIICSYDETQVQSTIYDDYELDMGKKNNADPPVTIDIWGRDNYIDLAYSNKTTLVSLETTGQLKQIFYEADAIPSIDGRDIDGDGDLDLVLSIGNLYFLKNVGDPSNPEYILDSNYFKDINEVRGKRSYGFPQWVEFDHDDDWDIVMGYTNRLGATYFDNYGTVNDPRWQEKKSLVSNLDPEANINVYNLTIPYFLSYMDYSPWYAADYSAETGEDYSTKYYLYFMKDKYSDTLLYFKISYDLQTSYLAAINPVLSRIEINSFKSERIEGMFDYYKRNFGFRAVESWSTRLDLYNWSLTLDTADLDEDGNPEIIVGDFDNNIYAFEHMVNNTYKRAFRSPDMMQFKPTNQTPYAWEQFGGYEGDFNQTVWNHVSYLVVDADVDQDGLKEMIAIAGTVIYIFEATGIDDTYTLMARYDVYRSNEGSFLQENNVEEPTGLAWANDMDQDGYSEIIVAFQKQLFVYEYMNGDFAEVFGIVNSNYTNSGHYALPGNSKYSNVTIAGVRVADLDLDGYFEIIVFGDVGYQGWYERGFLGVIESKINGYELVWQAPDEYMLSDKVLTVEIADQDYDGIKELVVGGEKGVTIFEYNGTEEAMSFKAVNVITGHANYPVMPTIGLFGVNNGRDLVYRSHDMIQLQYGSNHSFLAVWLEDNGTYWVPYYAFSDETGKVWYTPQQIAIPYFNPSPHDAFSPTVFQAPTGRIYIGWVQKAMVLGETAIWYLLLRYSDDTGNSWSNVYAVTVGSSQGGNPFRTPVFFANGTTNDIGYAYIDNNGTSIIARYGQFDSVAGSGTDYGIINGTEEFILNGLDVYNHPDGERLGIVFSGVKPDENREDYDIWYVELNSTYQALGPARKIYGSPAIEHTPSLSYLATGNHPAIVTFDAAGIDKAMTTSYAIVSENYIDWSKPDCIGTYPTYVYPLQIGNALYPRISSYPYSTYYVRGTSFTGPKVTPVIDGGYAILTKMDMIIDYEGFSGWGTEHHDELLFQRQTVLNVDLSLLDKATDLAVGDSDSDGLKEILVADGHYARLFEISETGDYLQHYYNSWFSTEFENTVSDVGIADTNTNGFPELIMSVQGEDVYVFEAVNVTKPIVNLQTVFKEYNQHIASSNFYNTIKFDIDNNGIQDLITVASDGRIYAIFGENGSIAWAEPYTPDVIYLEGIANSTTRRILTVGSHGDITYYDCLTGASTSVQMEGQPTLKTYITTHDFNNDGTPDVLGWYPDTNSLLSFDGNTGSQLGRIDFAPANPVALGTAMLEDSELILYALTNDTLMARSTDLQYINWTAAIPNTDLNSFVVGDINNDSIDEIFILGKPSYLFSANGTQLWNVTLNYAPSRAAMVDINNDGILDIVTNKGNTTTITVFDGSSGEIIWDYPTTEFEAGVFTIDNTNNSTIIYFSYRIAGNSAGFGALSQNGQLLFIAPTDNVGTTDYPQFFIPVTIGSERGVMVVIHTGDIDGYVMAPFDYEPPATPVYPNKLPTELISSRDYEVNTDTVIYDNFYDLGASLVFVENGTTVVWYDVINGKQQSSLTILSSYGSIMKMVPADLKGEGYPTGVFFYTEYFDLGYLDINDMAITWYGHEYGKFEEVYDIAAAPAVVGSQVIDQMAIAFTNVQGMTYVRYYDTDGNQVWADVQIFRAPYMLLAGPMLPAMDEGSYMIAAVSDSTLTFILAKDGTVYDTKDGRFGYAIVAPHSNKVPYYHLIIRDGKEIKWYNATLKTWDKIMGMYSTNEILAMDVAEINGDDWQELFVTQNGTRIYAFDGTTKEIMWTHNHSSFMANNLQMYVDAAGDNYLLTNDNHRLFLISAKEGTIIEATYDRYTTINVLQLSYGRFGSTDMSAVFLAENTFYGYRLPSSFSMEEAEQNLPMPSERVLKLSVTASLIIGFTISVMVIITRKPKKY